MMVNSEVSLHAMHQYIYILNSMLFIVASIVASILLSN